MKSGLSCLHFVLLGRTRNFQFFTSRTWWHRINGSVYQLRYKVYVVRYIRGRFLIFTDKLIPNTDLFSIDLIYYIQSIFISIKWLIDRNSVRLQTSTRILTETVTKFVRYYVPRPTSVDKFTIFWFGLWREVRITWRQNWLSHLQSWDLTMTDGWECFESISTRYFESLSLA